MRAPTVVALGPVDAEIAADVLGQAIRFVAEPTADDLRAAEAAIVRAAVEVDEAALDAAPGLRVVARTGVGVERVDLAACARRGVAVAITPGSGTDAVAEGVVAHALHLVKRLPQLHETVRSGRFRDGAAVPVGDIAGSTVGVVGLGRIGLRVAELMEALGARVLAHDPYAPPGDPRLVDDLDELLAAADVVSLHAPLTDATRQLIDRDALSRMPAGAVLVNLGRGPLLDLDAAHAALEAGRLGGLGLDVFDAEPPDHHAVFDHPRVLLTPHRMGLTTRAMRTTVRMAAQACRDVIEGHPPRHTAETPDAVPTTARGERTTP